MRRLLSTVACGALALMGAGLTARAALATTLCVDGQKPGCFAQIQPALDAAADGDTIAIGPGTYAGGITITKGVDLVGTSAGATVIRGGGPVLTIGQFEGEYHSASRLRPLPFWTALSTRPASSDVPSGKRLTTSTVDVARLSV